MKRGRGRPKDSKNKKAREPDFYFKKYGDEAWRRDGTEQRGHTRRSMVRVSKAHFRQLLWRARREWEDHEEAIAQDYASNPESMELIRQYLAKYPPERLGDLSPDYPPGEVFECGSPLNKGAARIFLRALAIASKREG